MFQYNCVKDTDLNFIKCSHVTKYSSLIFFSQPVKNIKLILSAHMKPGSGLGVVGGVWFAIPGLEQGLVIDDELRWDKQQGKHSHRF